MKLLITLLSALIVSVGTNTNAKDWVQYEGKEGPGSGKHIVFVTGDEEYRSEEGMPMLAKILAVHHGFKCTVLFAINPEDGMIDPNNSSNVVGLEMLQDADMMVLFTRFREFPDDKMKYFVDFVNSGKPILGLRTSTHAFEYKKNPNSKYAKYTWNSKEWPGGFGQQVLGDTWISHHGNHGSESTRGIINSNFANHSILRGVDNIWGPTDVYGIIHLPADTKVLVHGQVLQGMKPTDKPVEGKKNSPMMPLVWIRNYTGETGHSSRIIGTTIGSAPDLLSEGLRRLLINACYWGLGIESQIPAKSNAEIVGEFKPTFFGFNGYKRGVKPSHHELK